MNFFFKPAVYFLFSFLVLVTLWFYSPLSLAQNFLAQNFLAQNSLAQNSTQPTGVKTGLGDPRLAQLEFKVSALQSQLNRLQSQLAQTGSVSTGSVNGGSLSDIPVSGPVVGSDDFATNLSAAEQFDNLATLVVEMNQRLAAVERRLVESSQ